MKTERKTRHARVPEACCVKYDSLCIFDPHELHNCDKMTVSTLRATGGYGMSLVPTNSLRLA